MGTDAKKKTRAPKSKTPKEKPERKLKRSTMIDLYEARQYLGLDTLKETGLRMPVEVYFKDPAVAAKYRADAGIDEDFTTPWEPGLRDGPTSARFAVVDYDSTNNMLTPPAIWDRETELLSGAGRQDVLDGKTKELYQFHQLSVWAIVQNTLDFFESGSGARPPNQLGVRGQPADRRAARRIRRERLLRPGQQVAAVLLVRRRQRTRSSPACPPTSSTTSSATPCSTACGPHYYESVGAQTAAFHEFMGDLTAILMAFRNNAFRKIVLKESNGKLTDAQLLAGLAQQFGRGDQGHAVSAQRPERQDDEDARGQSRAARAVGGADRRDVRHPHGGVRQAPEERSRNVRRPAAARSRATCRALADTVPRMQMLAIQPLDLLPPCAVTFRDYALAVLRSRAGRQSDRPARAIAG